MARTLFMFGVIACVIGIVTVESASPTTKTLTSVEHIKQLVDTVGGSCRGNCSSDVNSVTTSDTDVKVALCISFKLFKICFDDKCYDAPSDVRTNVHLANEICDGCSTVKISGMILVLMLLFNMLFKFA